MLKGRYFDEPLEPNSCLAPLTSIVEKKKYGSQCTMKVPQLFSSNRSSKYLLLCSAEEKNS